MAKYLSYTLATLLIVALTIGCNGILDSSQTNCDSAGEAQLQPGFGTHWVSVELNNEIRYEAFLDAGPPAARTLVSLLPESPQESHRLVVRWVPIDGNKPVSSYEKWLSFDQSTGYQIGIDALGNTIQVIIQAGPVGHV
jgi:hypothetical protein